MNNEMTLNIREMKTQLVMNQLVTVAMRPLHRLSAYYGQILERPIGTRETLHLLNVQLAFVATVFVASPILFRLLCMAWLITALLKCKKVLGK